MKLQFDYIDGITTKRSGAYGMVLEVSGGMDTEELILTAMEYGSIKDIVRTLLIESGKNRELITQALLELDNL